MGSSSSENVRQSGASSLEIGGRLTVEPMHVPAQHDVHSAPLITTLADELPKHKTNLEKYRGKEYLGLPQRTLSGIDNAISGFRGLMLLAAPPNVGKTALGVQIGLDIVKHNPDTCFLFVSMEMSRWDIMTRMLCRLAHIDYDELVRGQFCPPNGRQDSQQQLRDAEIALGELGRRIRILDDEAPSLEVIRRELEALKLQTGTSKAFILVDYLQIWSIPDGTQGRIHSDLDADKYRIGAMKQLRSTGDAVLVISEVRKQSGTGGLSDPNTTAALADVMGSARAGYTPDMVFILRPKDVASASQSSKPRKLYNDETPPTLPASLLVQELEFQIVKGRDGVTKRTIPLKFYYTRHRFEEASGR